MIHSFPKIFTLGTNYIQTIFEEKVEITEKIDGCVCLQEPVLMADLSYKKAVELNEGDEILGFDENLNNPRLRRGKVTHAQIIKKECVSVVLQDDRVIEVSIDHPFLVRDLKNKIKGLSKRWVEAQHLQKGDKIVDLGFWEKQTDYNTGYVAGQFDGEGTIVGNGNNHNTKRIAYYQAPNKGLDLIKDILLEKEISVKKYSRKPRKEGHQFSESLEIRGGLTGKLKFLGVFRPQRLLGMAYEKLWGDAPMNAINDISVVSIKGVGRKEVVGLSTSTKTYITKGLLSHNSQFTFGSFNGELQIKSKKNALYVNDCDGMFALGVDYVSRIAHLLPDGLIFHAEYLKTPKHNVLCYGRVPKNNIMLYGIRRPDDSFIEDLNPYLEMLDLERVPIIFKGKINNLDEIHALMNRESILGEVTIEGLVVKNFAQPFLFGGQAIPLMMGKMVSEKFKEVHKSQWGKQDSGMSKLETFFQSFCTEARWEKAVQHLRDAGELSGEPKDIGPLTREIHQDIIEEEKEAIKTFLWGHFNKMIKSRATRGFPEWYKESLLKTCEF